MGVPSVSCQGEFMTPIGLTSRARGCWVNVASLDRHAWVRLAPGSARSAVSDPDRRDGSRGLRRMGKPRGVPSRTPATTRDRTGRSESAVRRRRRPVRRQSARLDRARGPRRPFVVRLPRCARTSPETRPSEWRPPPGRDPPGPPGARPPARPR
jgi:hypothetical protein